MERAIYQLPLPQEICSKILMFACKSPHTGLGVGLLKKKLNERNLDIPENDENVTHICCIPQYSSINIYFYSLFKNLTEISLAGHIGVSGDIADLKLLPNLTVIHFAVTMVTGDIEHLKSLPNLTSIALGLTSVTGDIIHLKSLPKLTEIRLSEAHVMGDIKHLKTLPNLTYIDISWTGVTGDGNAFCNYRNNTGLESCELYM